MKRVLFVCLGNICRSPMAEAIFRHLVRAKGLEDKIIVDSAGTGNWHIGKPPHEGTRKILTEHQIDYEGMKARQITIDDFSKFDYIVAMDESNLRNTNALRGEAESAINGESQIFRLLNLIPESKLENVPDPYYTGNFEEVYEMVEEGCKRLLNKIIQDNPSLQGHN